MLSSNILQPSLVLAAVGNVAFILFIGFLGWRLALRLSKWRDGRAARRRAEFRRILRCCLDPAGLSDLADEILQERR